MCQELKAKYHNDNYILWLHCRIECVHNDIDQLFTSIETREWSKCEKTSLKHQIYGVIFHSIKKFEESQNIIGNNCSMEPGVYLQNWQCFFLSIWFNIHIIVASHELYVRRAGHRKQETISGIFFCFYSFFFQFDLPNVFKFSENKVSDLTHSGSLLNFM